MPQSPGITWRKLRLCAPWLWCTPGMRGRNSQTSFTTQPERLRQKRWRLGHAPLLGHRHKQAPQAKPLQNHNITKQASGKHGKGSCGVPGREVLWSPDGQGAFTKLDKLLPSSAWMNICENTLQGHRPLCYLQLRSRQVQETLLVWGQKHRASGQRSVEMTTWEQH